MLVIRVCKLLLHGMMVLMSRFTRDCGLPALVVRLSVNDASLCRSCYCIHVEVWVRKSRLMTGSIFSILAQKRMGMFLKDTRVCSEYVADQWSISKS